MKTLNKAVKALAVFFAICLMMLCGIEAQAAENNDTTITVLVDRLKVRENPSTDARRIGTVKLGETHPCIDTVGDQWVAIEYHGKIAYVYGKYVTINCMDPVVQETVETFSEEDAIIEVSVIEEDHSGDTIVECEEITPQPDAAREEILVSAEALVPEETPVPEETMVPEEALVPEETMVPAQTALSEETMVPEETLTPEPEDIQEAEIVQPVEDSEEIKLLAALIQCEAVGESYEGQVAVGDIVMNRVADPRFPDSICEVIYQPRQFSPIGTGKVGRILASGDINESCLAAAREAYAGASVVDGCVSFRRVGKVSGMVIGRHVFF